MDSDSDSECYTVSARGLRLFTGNGNEWEQTAPPARAARPPKPPPGAKTGPPAGEKPENPRGQPRGGLHSPLLQLLGSDLPGLQRVLVASDIYSERLFAKTSEGKLCLSGHFWAHCSARCRTQRNKSCAQSKFCKYTTSRAAATAAPAQP